MIPQSTKGAGQWARLAAAVVAGTVALNVALSAPALADPADHAIVVCQSASFYRNYNSATREPVGFLWSLPYGNKVGHLRNRHPVYNGWAATFDYGPQQWGFMRYSCIGKWGSW